MPHCFHSNENNNTPRESKHDISRQHDKDEVGLGVIFNELCDKMTAIIPTVRSTYEEVKYIEPSHRKLYGKGIRRRLVPPYQAHGFSTGKKKTPGSPHLVLTNHGLLTDSCLLADQGPLTDSCLLTDQGPPTDYGLPADQRPLTDQGLLTDQGPLVVLWPTRAL